MECQFFAENRIQLISRNFTQRPNILKFKQIMCTSEKIKLEKLCNLYSQINHTLQWYREVTYKNTTQHIHDK
jgi:hypothetical protein